MHPSRVICTPLLPYRVLMEVTLIDVFLTIVFMLIGYLAGAIPTGLFVARARGVDIRKLGSGNIGATNVLRTMGTLPALLVVLVDPLKAFLAVYFPVWLGADPWTVALTGFAVLLGNTYNVFLGLRGGRGIATSLGLFFAIDPLITTLIGILGITTMALGRYVSLGSLVGVIATPLMLIAKGGIVLPYFYLALVIMTLAVFRHRDNLRRLAAGTERRLGEKSPRTPAAEDSKKNRAKSTVDKSTNEPTGQPSKE